ncbi:MAG: CapA family protein [Calditrichaeota bacterium]|nr:MAG: CapA family protein [Calditrichota bacterium]
MKRLQKRMPKPRVKPNRSLIQTLFKFRGTYLFSAIRNAFLCLIFIILAQCSAGEKMRDSIIFTPSRDLSYPYEEIAFRQSYSQGSSPAVQIIAGGDVMIGHWTLSYLKKHGNDYPFRGIKHVLRDHDIVFANLEAPFADTGKIQVEKQYTFKVPTTYVQGLQSAGFNMMSLANNHILDFGFEGLQQTVYALDRAGIHHAGAGMTAEAAWEPAIMQTASGRVALLAFSMTFPKEFWATDSTGGTAYPFERKLKKALHQVRTQADIVITSFHWGKEKSHQPKDYQQHFAHFAIDHGADLVLGHHPHVLQGLEIYNGKLIAYSLGNLAFSSYSQTAVNSALLRIALTKEGDLLFARVIPLNVDNSEVEFQPKIASEQRSRAILTQLDTLSFKLMGRDILSDNGLIFDFLQPDSLVVKDTLF